MRICLGLLASVSISSGIHTLHGQIYLGNLSELQLFWIHTSIFFLQMAFANIVITTNATVHKKPIGTELVVFSAFFLALFSLQLFSNDDDDDEDEMKKNFTKTNPRSIPFAAIATNSRRALRHSGVFCECRTIFPRMKKNRERKKGKTF